MKTPLRCAPLPSLPLLSMLLVLVTACEEKPSASATPSATASIAAAPAKAPAPASASAAQEKLPLQILRFTLTSEVKAKEPVDKLEVAETGQRVWAHLAVRNRTGASKRLTLRFLVGEEERSSVDLTVESSWSYRTWGYNTLRASDKSGELNVEVRDDEGALLQRATLPIKAAKKAAPK
ncbi:MAG: hypothetical protein ABI193_11975 [Minicystis sp.]